jgi:hypothetical protein
VIINDEEETENLILRPGYRLVQLVHCYDLDRTQLADGWSDILVDSGGSGISRGRFNLQSASATYAIDGRHCLTHPYIFPRLNVLSSLGIDVR